MRASCVPKVLGGGARCARGKCARRDSDAVARAWRGDLLLHGRPSAPRPCGTQNQTSPPSSGLRGVMVGPSSASRESVCASCTASRGRRRAARLVLCPRRIIARSRACRLRRRWLCRARTTAGGPSSPQRWAVGGASRRPRGRVEQGSLTPRARPLEGRRRPRRRDFRPPGAAARGRAPAPQPGGLGAIMMMTRRGDAIVQTPLAGLPRPTTAPTVLPGLLRSSRAMPGADAPLLPTAAGLCALVDWGT